MGKQQNILGFLIFTLVCLFLLYEMGLQVFPSVMTESLMHDFTVSATSLSLLSSSYFYSYTLMQIPVGLLFDRLSAKGLIATALFLCSRLERSFLHSLIKCFGPLWDGFSLA